MFWNRRSDAKIVADVPAYRRVMPYLMRGRNESAVYFDLHIDLTQTEKFLRDFNANHPGYKATLFHVVLWAAVQALSERPRLNRFVAGGRLWQRDGIWVSYSAKKRLDDNAPIVVLKRRFDAESSFEDMVKAQHTGLSEGRSSRKSRVDRELSAVLSLPAMAIRTLLTVGRVADGLGLLPRSFIDGDPMFCSMFIANLGSLKMDAAYHHLYEYGNCPIFCVIGQTKQVPRVVEGEVVPRKEAVLRFSYDERVEDGLYAQRALQRLAQRVESPATQS